MNCSADSADSAYAIQMSSPQCWLIFKVSKLAGKEIYVADAKRLE